MRDGGGGAAFHVEALDPEGDHGRVVEVAVARREAGIDCESPYR